MLNKCKSILRVVLLSALVPVISSGYAAELSGIKCFYTGLTEKSPIPTKSNYALCCADPDGNNPTAYNLPSNQLGPNWPSVPAFENFCNNRASDINRVSGKDLIRLVPSKKCNIENLREVIKASDKGSVCSLPRRTAAWVTQWLYYDIEWNNSQKYTECYDPTPRSNPRYHCNGPGPFGNVK